jgi:hypothetical protein
LVSAHRQPIKKRPIKNEQSLDASKTTASNSQHISSLSCYEHRVMNTAYKNVTQLTTPAAGADDTVVPDDALPIAEQLLLNQRLSDTATAKAKFFYDLMKYMRGYMQGGEFKKSLDSNRIKLLTDGSYDSMLAYIIDDMTLHITDNVLEKDGIGTNPTAVIITTDLGILLTKMCEDNHQSGSNPKAPLFKADWMEDWMPGSEILRPLVSEYVHKVVKDIFDYSSNKNIFTFTFTMDDIPALIHTMLSEPVMYIHMSTVAIGTIEVEERKSTDGDAAYDDDSDGDGEDTPPLPLGDQLEAVQLQQLCAIAPTAVDVDDEKPISCDNTPCNGGRAFQTENSAIIDKSKMFCSYLCAVEWEAKPSTHTKFIDDFFAATAVDDNDVEDEQDEEKEFYFPPRVWVLVKRFMLHQGDDWEEEVITEERKGDVVYADGIDGRTITLTMAGGGSHWWKYVLVFRNEGEYELYIDSKSGREHLPDQQLVMFNEKSACEYTKVVGMDYELHHDAQSFIPSIVVCQDCDYSMTQCHFDDGRGKVMHSLGDDTFRCDDCQTDEADWCAFVARLSASTSTKIALAAATAANVAATGTITFSCAVCLDNKDINAAVTCGTCSHPVCYFCVANIIKVQNTLENIIQFQDKNVEPLLAPSMYLDIIGNWTPIMSNTAFSLEDTESIRESDRRGLVVTSDVLNFPRISNLSGFEDLILSWAKCPQCRDSLTDPIRHEMYKPHILSEVLCRKVVTISSDVYIMITAMRLAASGENVEFVDNFISYGKNATKALLPLYYTHGGDLSALPLPPAERVLPFAEVERFAEAKRLARRGGLSE